MNRGESFLAWFFPMISRRAEPFTLCLIVSGERSLCLLVQLYLE
ncbi:hypothetical protein CSUI_007294 [Cystoisospora suis]|uniref:Uncharacterized protein n=1 Tax=Cystoisospora suis TaxID=483139 RepID=A0A2C6KQK5_9APIC|nr:hypothetical protein CSUI_007294 [Cystoisospora suis]